MSNKQPTRRDILRAGVIASGAAIVAPATSLLAAERPRPLRLAHLTDMHVQPERLGGEGFAAALDSVTKLDPPPDLIITGGDHVMDVYETERPRADKQWNLYDRVLRAGTRRPVYPVMGNHDVWGWGVPGQVPPDTPGYGKALAMDRLGMKRSYYSFDAPAGSPWHFICLDNIAPLGLNYYGGLDDEQTEWLTADLKAVGSERPVCIVSHIPLLAVCVFFDGEERVAETFWHVPYAWMHRNVKPLLNLFKPYNVRLLLSGHIHLVDRVEYLGMTFICDGAVCGAWWKGPNQEFAEGYGVVDLWPDGSFEHGYVTYGWKA